MKSQALLEASKEVGLEVDTEKSSYVFKVSLRKMFTGCRVNKSRMMKWAEHVIQIGEMGNAYRILVGNPERKRPLGRPKRR